MKKTRMMSYQDTVDKIFEENEQYFERPFVPASLHQLQVLSDKLCSCVAWVTPVTVKLAECPDDCGIQLVENFIKDKFTINTIPQAMIDMEVDYKYQSGCEQGVVYGTSVIYFFDKRFLSVGTLLHELAHLHPPFNNHGKRFKLAHAELVDKFNSVFKQCDSIYERI